MLGRPSPDLADRSLLAKWLVNRGLTGLFIEVGVHRGGFAQEILQDWPGRYMGVDPWLVLPEYYDNLDHSSSVSQSARNADLEETRRVLRPFCDRAVIHRGTSAQVAANLPDGIADCVYIDANHEYESIRQDLDLWWPKLKPGGILSGHDYAHCYLPTVGRAVDEFATEHNMDVWIVPAPDQFASWYLLPKSETEARSSTMAPPPGDWERFRAAR
jgi:hypothetical protein